MSTLRSEFLEIVSTSQTDYQVIDLSGAVESVFTLKPLTASGNLTNEPYANSPRLHISDQMSQPLVTRSNDNRLYWVSAEPSDSVLQVWVIRRG